jgi:hypothetical protein
MILHVISPDFICNFHWFYMILHIIYPVFICNFFFSPQLWPGPCRRVHNRCRRCGGRPGACVAVAGWQYGGWQWLRGSWGSRMVVKWAKSEHYWVRYGKKNGYVAVWQWQCGSGGGSGSGSGCVAVGGAEWPLNGGNWSSIGGVMVFRVWLAGGSGCGSGCGRCCC